ncbi:MAG: PQQ-binding-like beta-propeller repeat protein, partial [Anaerolineae bacterium]
NDGIVIDRAQSVEQWFYEPGFGSQMVVADLDSDGRDELISNVNRITVFDVELRAPAYQLPGYYWWIEALYAGDVTGDGVPDIIGGEEQSGSIRLWDGATHQPLWVVNKGADGSCGIGLGDADGDGETDLIWCAGTTSSAPDHLFLAPISRRTALFTSRDLDGPYGPIPMQLDDDDALELVIFTYASDSGYGGPTYFVVDSATGREEPDLHIDIDLPSDYPGIALTSLLANVNSDPEQEVILGIGNDLYILDHHGRRLQKTTFSTPLTPVWVGDVDGDGVRDLVSYSSNRVNIHRLDTLEYTWQSPAFSEGVRGLAVADLDGDGHLNLLFHGSNSYLQAYDAQTRQLKWQGPPTQRVTALAVGNVDGGGGLEIVTVENDYLTFYDAATRSLIPRTLYLPGVRSPNPLTLAYVMDTPFPQLIVHVNRIGPATDSELWLFKHAYASQPTQILRGSPWSMTLADTDSDHHMDLLVGHTLGAKRYRFRETFRDRVPPIGWPLTPAPGATSVSRNTFAEVVFDKAIAPETITPQTAQLRVNGESLTVTRAYDAATRALRLTPQALLPPTVSVTVWLSPDVRDLSGNGLDGNLNGVGGEAHDALTWSFTTGAGIDTVGPAIHDLALQPNPAWAGMPVQMSATADDTNPDAVSMIRRAEYFLDEVGEPGAGRPMLAADGRFDEPTEQITATLDTTGWQGKRRLYVRAENSVGHWGAPSVITLTLQAELTANWPTFGHDPGHSGYNPSQGSMKGATLAWERDVWNTIGATHTRALEQVAVANGLVVANSNSYHGRGGILAMDAQDGHELWRRILDDKYSVNPASIAYGNVYFQQNNHSEDSFLFALNALLGAQVWSAPFAAQWGQYYAPAVADGKVFIVGGYYDGMYGFDAARGRQLWFAQLPQNDSWTPAYSGGAVYSLVSGILKSWNPRIGAEAWAVDSGCDWEFCSMNRIASIAGNTAYFTTQRMGGSPLSAVDLVSRREKWRVAGDFIGTPAVADNEVYALDGAVLRVFDAATGQPLWSFTTSDTLAGAPVVTRDEVFIASSGQTWGINRAGHEVIVNQPKGGWLTIANDQLYIAQPNGVLSVYAVPRP